MRILPVLFNTDMVLATLEGRKTAIRRAVKYEYDNTEMKMRTDKYGIRLIEIQKDVEGETHGKYQDGRTWRKLRPYVEKRPPYRPGDILYVRETWAEWTGGYLYRAWQEPFAQPGESAVMRWRPSIHMPKAAARIWLGVTDVGVERLQDMKPEDIRKEGMKLCVIPEECWSQYDKLGAVYFYGEARAEFAGLWDSTIRKSDRDRYGWDANPWVWVVGFERCGKPEEGRKE